MCHRCSTQSETDNKLFGILQCDGRSVWFFVCLKPDIYRIVLIIILKMLMTQYLHLKHGSFDFL